MDDLQPGDRVRDLNHTFTPSTGEHGTVDYIDPFGGVYVNWDGEGVHPIPSDAVTLTRI